MSKKLNNWQTWTLFSPFIFGSILMDIPGHSFYNYQTTFAIANLLFVLNVFTAVCYQTYLVLNFNAEAGVQSGPFKWNACIPLIFSFLSLMDIIYGMVTRQTVHSHQNIPGPVIQTGTTLTNSIIYLLLIHAFITFYFINPQFISRKINAESNTTRQEQLKLQFLIPVKRLIKTSIWVFVIFIALNVLGDLVKFGR